MLASADLVVTKTGPATVMAGTLLTYTLTLTNQGPDAASNVVLNDAIPAGTAFSAFSTSAVGFNTAVNSNLTQVRANAASMASGDTATFTFVVSANASDAAGSTISNTATASSDTPDPNTNNDSATASSTVQAQADVGITKVGPASAIAGTNITYSFSATNQGPSDAQAVTLSDSLPFGLVFVGGGASQGSEDADPNGHVTISFGTIPAGGTATATVIAHINSSTPNNSTLVNVVNESSTTSDVNSTNNTAVASTSVTTQADLTMLKTGPATAVAGTTITYTLTITNNGPSDALNLGLADTLQGSALLGSLQLVSGPGLAALPAGQTDVFTLSVHVLPTAAAGSVLHDTASIFTTTTDPNAANNSSSADTTVITRADLVVTKTASPNPVLLGGDITFTVNVANNGPSDAQNVVLSDPLPTGTVFVSEQQTSGPAYALGHPNVGVNGTVSNTIGTLAAGASASFQIVVQAQSRALAQTIVANTATISSATTDTNTNNNSSTTSTQVFDQADLAVFKASPLAVLSGDNLTYNLSVINNGPIFDPGVVLTDAIPANTTFVSESQFLGPAFTCSTPPVGGTGTIACSIASLPAGALATFQIVVHVNSNAPNLSDIVNTARVTGQLFDPNTANNTAVTHTTAVTLTAELAITGTVAPSTLKANGSGPLVYTLTVTNTGPNTASNVVVVDTLPGQVGFTGEKHPAGWASIDPSLGSAGNVVFTIASLAPGASATFTIVIKAPPLPAGTNLTNTASVSSSTFDPNLLNNVIPIVTHVQ